MAEDSFDFERPRRGREKNQDQRLAYPPRDIILFRSKAKPPAQTKKVQCGLLKMRVNQRDSLSLRDIFDLGEAYLLMDI